MAKNNVPPPQDIVQTRRRVIELTYGARWNVIVRRFYRKGWTLTDARNRYSDFALISARGLAHLFQVSEKTTASWLSYGFIKSTRFGAYSKGKSKLGTHKGMHQIDPEEVLRFATDPTFVGTLFVPSQITDASLRDVAETVQRERGYRWFLPERVAIDTGMHDRTVRAYCALYVDFEKNRNLNVFDPSNLEPYAVKRMGWWIKGVEEGGDIVYPLVAKRRRKR